MFTDVNPPPPLDHSPVYVPDSRFLLFIRWSVGVTMRLCDECEDSNPADEQAAESAASSCCRNSQRLNLSPLSRQLLPAQWDSSFTFYINTRGSFLKVQSGSESVQLNIYSWPTRPTFTSNHLINSLCEAWLKPSHWWLLVVLYILNQVSSCFSCLAECCHAVSCEAPEVFWKLWNFSWRYVDNDWMFMFGWTAPLNSSTIKPSLAQLSTLRFCCCSWTWSDVTSS